MGLILLLVVVYAVICVAVYCGNRQLMYFPDPARVPPAAVGLDGVEEITIAATDGTTLIAWLAFSARSPPSFGCRRGMIVSSHFGKLVRPIISVPVCARMRAMGGARLCLPKINT